MVRVLRVALLCALLAISVLAQNQSIADRFPMNVVQVLGSHNSYKEAIDPALLQVLERDDPKKLDSLEYSHPSYAEQLDLGLRNLEIDVVHDPKGGRYAMPVGLQMAKQAPYDTEKEMLKPGLKVIHVPDIDFRSTTYTFREALRQIRAWSDKHPRHLPVIVTMNAKDVGADIPNPTVPLPFDAAAFDAWDAEIREILPSQSLLTPDDVRGTYPSLEAAVRAHAWPTIGNSRGKFLFVLDETGTKLETYVKGHPSLKGRVMFVNAVEGRPEAAFRIVNDPIGSFNYIQSLVRAGYLVRTRADADTREARQNDRSRMQAAFESGAQFVTTDYYRPNPAFNTGYRVVLPGGLTIRWNPIIPPPGQGLPRPE